MHKKDSPPRIYSKSWQCHERAANEPIQILTENEAEVYHMKNSFSVLAMGLVVYTLYQRLHILPDFNGSLSNISVFNPTNSKKTLKNRKQKIYTDMKRCNLQSPSCVSPTLSRKI